MGLEVGGTVSRVVQWVLVMIQAAKVLQPRKEFRLVAHTFRSTPIFSENSPRHKPQHLRPGGMFFPEVLLLLVQNFGPAIVVGLGLCDTACNARMYCRRVHAWFQE